MTAARAGDAYGPGPGAAAVLGALREAGAAGVSGETLSGRLEVSRAQIWKYVEALRGLGWTIEGEPGGGYRLAGAPNLLYAEEIVPRLRTRWLGRALHVHDVVDSTNRIALELARAGAPHGTAVLAEGQTAGRGRLGRSFFSPHALNLYTSILLRPSLELADAPTLILSSGLAVADAVAETLGGDDDVEIKWPNDVLVGGRKTSGILMELGSEASRVAFVVLGIGVNLNVSRDELPEELRDLATSLRIHAGHEIDRPAFVARMYHALERTLDAHEAGGFAALRPRFERRFRMAGRTLRVREVAGRAGEALETAGICRGIDEDGALLVERDDGEIARIVAGDVTLVKPPRPAARAGDREPS